jgi:ribosomal protein L37AE/L43A
MDPEQVPIKTFDPLLRDLLHWGLLVRAEEPAGTTWQLSERAAARLNDISAETHAFSAERMVFLDHRCGACGVRRLTRLRESRYICDACWDAAEATPATVTTTTDAPTERTSNVANATALREHRWTPPWRQRSA